MKTTNVVLALLLAVTVAAGETNLQYPQTKKVDQKDTYAGSVVVADPYRWLETDVRQSSDVRAWVGEQNKVTFGYLRSLPHRDAIKDRLTKLWNYEKFSVPVRKGGRYFFSKNSGLQNQSVLHTQNSLSDPPRSSPFRAGATGASSSAPC